MATPVSPPRRRMTAAEREKQLLSVAVTAFAEGGYAGTTTDQVARWAGVSQPYVVRLFGTKQALFLAVQEHVAQRIQDTLRAAAAAAPPGAEPDERLSALGRAYTELVADRELLRVLLHGFAAAADPAIGPWVRRGFTNIYRLVRELTGADPEQARDFLARGMLINVVVALRMPEHLAEDPAIDELVACVLPCPPRDAH